jgi:hypothetical protein
VSPSHQQSSNRQPPDELEELEDAEELLAVEPPSPPDEPEEVVAPVDESDPPTPPPGEVSGEVSGEHSGMRPKNAETNTARKYAVELSMGINLSRDPRRYSVHGLLRRNYPHREPILPSTF